MKFSEDLGNIKDKTPCAGSRADLKMCLLESDCCRKLGKTPRQCLHATDGSVPDECFAIRYAFFECKRSALDTRTRFRGRKAY